MVKKKRSPVDNSESFLSATIHSSLSSTFTETARDWIAEGGSLIVRWFATSGEHGTINLIDGSLNFGPLGSNVDDDFSVIAGCLRAGQKTYSTLSATKSMQIIEKALAGMIELGPECLQLQGVEARNHYSESLQRDQWFTDLHLQIAGEQLQQPALNLLIAEDNAVRRATLPFDGVRELTQWLGLTDKRTTHQPATITIRVGTPVDFLFVNSHFRANQLEVAFVAHPGYLRKNIGVAVKAYPGRRLESRRQVAGKIKWMPVRNGIRQGHLRVVFENADSAMVMLSLAGYTVRRQWFLDPDKAANTRLLAMQACDKDLKQLKQALLEKTDSFRFEQAVAALLFLLGFSAGPQLEKDAPDIVFASPGGALGLVECTTRISDFHLKAGKLVDRRQTLVAKLEESGQPMRVDAFLVSSQSREQIAAEASRLAEFNVMLLCREDITAALTRVRQPGQPDKMLEDVAKQLASLKHQMG